MASQPLLSTSFSKYLETATATGMREVWEGNIIVGYQKIRISGIETRISAN